MTKEVHNFYLYSSHIAIRIRNLKKGKRMNDIFKTLFKLKISLPMLKKGSLIKQYKIILLEILA